MKNIYIFFMCVADSKIYFFIKKPYKVPLFTILF